MELLLVGVVVGTVWHLYWRSRPIFNVTKHFSLWVCLGSLLDDGPLHWGPDKEEEAQTRTEDPNANPHYIWNQTEGD